MKIFKTLYTILIGLCCSMANAQIQDSNEKQNQFAFFEIKDARYNEGDITEQALNKDATLIFYQSTESDSILFSNYWKNS
jgi:hypothetical protein